MNLRFAKTLSIAGMLSVLVWPTMPTAATGSNGTVNAPVMQAIPLKLGEPFLRARARIITLGWKPFPMHQNGDYEYSGIEKELVGRKFLELDGCSVDAGVLCIFYYSKLNECLRVDTIGESLRQITVTQWSRECPEKNQ
jgi:hypothetical protein